MVRSKFKGPVIDNSTKKVTANKSNLHRLNRNLKILPKHVDHTVEIHNGKSFEEVLVTEQMLGHNFGEFVFTRSKFTFKKKKNKKNKMGQKKKIKKIKSGRRR